MYILLVIIINIKSGIELTFLLISGESLFIKIHSLKDSLNALFSQHKIKNSLKLLQLSTNNCSHDHANSWLQLLVKSFNSFI